ncbi:MAG: hypothetical protein LPH21_14840 [Shewanella sp.]|nr:hypothetical protein [Shewanella sp.]
MSRLIDWYKIRHPKIACEIDNTPLQKQSSDSLMQLETSILLPLEHEFGALTVTYGFTSLRLKNYLQRYSPGQMAPSLDQHAASELNTKGNLICQRQGAAVDFLVSGYQDRMHLIAQHIIKHLPFDRLYFYSPHNAIHVSVGPENARAVQMMKPHPKGFFVPTKRATGKEARYLFENN